MKGLTGKVAIVTGGASGIGEAIVLRLAEEGCKVALFDINLEAAQGVSKKSQDSGAAGSVTPFVTDITSLEAVEASVEKVENELGPIWMLVNNAGWDKPAPFLSTGPDLWQKIVALNLMGPINLHSAVCKRMAARNEGRVINVASDAGRVGTSNEAVYSACKGGTIAFTKSMARELARNNVLVNAVCPGPTDTPAMAAVVGTGPEAEKWKESMARGIPLRRMAQADDYPGMIAFLGSDDAGYITGQSISISGGLTMS
ncbi:SDR family oxidoreductase [Spongiibacter taiwanensis]|uniref:SDR family NAD(P)-dependent oxidoreductase n=1 Tax=Spongiibacter taiwanensis TaxID=1748242 RepID=UPI002035B9E8|nr:SDR family NAD(P)-dependent oxidoreductase [Spongiibacter taiwanensis]USA42723.1 SDR family oxidoreductase [Spongiibacter taiwanensis]